MFFFDVLAQDGRVLCAMGFCCLCERCVPLEQLDVFEGPGQKAPACIACLAEFEQYCSCDSGEPLPTELSYEPIDDGWSDLDEATQSDEYKWDQRVSA